MIRLITATIDGKNYNLTFPLFLLCLPLMLLKSLGVPLSWWIVFLPMWIIPAFMVTLAAFCGAVLIAAFIFAILSSIFD